MKKLSSPTGRRRRPWRCRGGPSRTPGRRCRLADRRARVARPWYFRSCGSNPMDGVGVDTVRPRRCIAGPWIERVRRRPVRSPSTTPSPMTAYGPTSTPSASTAPGRDHRGGMDLRRSRPHPPWTDSSSASAHTRRRPSPSSGTYRPCVFSGQDLHLDTELVPRDDRPPELASVDAGRGRAACAPGRRRRPAGRPPRPAPSPRCMSTPGITGWPGKWPWKNCSLKVTFLIPTMRLPASISRMRSTSRIG